MKDKMTLREFISKLNHSDLRKNLLPMELASGWPYLSIKQKKLCVSIPYFMTKRADGYYLLFPISFVWTVTWPAGRTVEVTALKYDKKFGEIDFSRAVGKFKHPAIASYSEEMYEEKKTALFSLYDNLISCILDKKSFEQGDEMKALFSLLMEPDLLPMYRVLAPKFFEHYC